MLYVNIVCTELAEHYKVHGSVTFLTHRYHNEPADVLHLDNFCSTSFGDFLK